MAARVPLKVVDVVGSLVLKGIAIGDRYAEKDAYDIYALCAHQRGGPREVAEQLRPFREEPAVKSGASLPSRISSVHSRPRGPPG